MPDLQNTLTVSQIKTLPRAGGQSFTGVFLLRKITPKTAKNDNAYLAVELGDKTGSFATNIFSDSPAHSTFRAAKEGDAVFLEAKVDYYRDGLSPKVSRAEGIPVEQLSAEPALLERLLETAPINGAELWAEFQGHIAAIAHPELRATVLSLMEEIGEAFRVSPAAISMHHAYRNGLLEHTTRMARACRALAPLYPEVHADLALTGILLHDTGKTIEYEGEFGTRRSRRGILQGHVVLGYQLARKHGLKNKLNPDLLERLEHIILSHQGELEWGAAVMAATPEAVFVSMIDNLDAKMGVVQRALRQGGADAFTEKLLSLKSPLLLTPPAAGPDVATNEAG